MILAPGRISVVLIAAIAATDVVLLGVFGLSFDWPSAAAPGLACCVLAVLTAFYRLYRPDERLATALAGTAQLVAFTAAGAVLSYGVAAADRPLWDDAFAAADRALGLDWRGYLAFVGAHPWLSLAYDLAYKSILLQLVVASVALALSGRTAACREFVLAVILAGIVTIAVSAFMPAVSVFAHFGLPQAGYGALDTTAAFVHLKPLLGLRDGTLRSISLSHGEGIIAFPSFHAALATIFAVAFWRLPWVRWFGLALNATMIASTPLNGGHYFVDVLAGVIVAGAAIVAAHVLDRAALGSRSQVERSSAQRPLADEPLAA